MTLMTHVISIHDALAHMCGLAVFMLCLAEDQKVSSVPSREPL